MVDARWSGLSCPLSFSSLLVLLLHLFSSVYRRSLQGSIATRSFSSKDRDLDRDSSLWFEYMLPLNAFFSVCGRSVQGSSVGLSISHPAVCLDHRLHLRTGYCRFDGSQSSVLRSTPQWLAIVTSTLVLVTRLSLHGLSILLGLASFLLSYCPLPPVSSWQS